MADDFRPFAVYKTRKVALDLQDLINSSLLCEDVDASTWKAQSYSPERPFQILAFHKTLDDVNQSFLLIVDRQDVADEGLLCVNLDFNGCPDAVREKAHELRYALPSLSIDNTDWGDDILANADRPLYPRGAFAMFVYSSVVARGCAADVVDVVDGGLGGRRRGAGTVLAGWEGVETSDLEAMVRHFGDSRAQKGWRGDYFLCVEGSTVESGKVAIVSVRTLKWYEFTWEISGEVLVWLAVGLICEIDLEEVNSYGGVPGCLDCHTKFRWKCFQ